jgi:sporulation protein YlmC with PRC-barrel domain
MGEKDRLKRDSAGIGPEPRRSGLHKLSSLKDFRVAKGEPDIRGWEVRTLNGRDVGEVDDLLVDPESGEVVFMDIAMNNTRDHIELAIRTAQLDRDKNRVIVDSGDVDYEVGRAGGQDTARDRAPDRDPALDLARDREMERIRAGEAVVEPDRSVGEIG